MPEQQINTISHFDCTALLHHCDPNTSKSSKEHILFEIEIFLNIIDVFTVISDQFNAPLQNKSIKKYLSQTCKS